MVRKDDMERICVKEMLLKCKMCGGDMHLEHIENMKVCTCEYCGSRITLPKLDDDVKRVRYDRGNAYRLENNYDAARIEFNALLDTSLDDPEIYWSILLCDFGIEYVKDPATGKRVPTCHRTNVSSIFDNVNYKSVMKYASGEARDLYQKEAEEIDNIQRRILQISQSAEKYDIFICYKESDAQGNRTIDSVIAQEMFDKLEKESYHVFFARQSLRNVAGSSYEPYIYSALQSAKVMIVVGSSPEYINAPWVKNEWERFLSYIDRGEKKKLIPAIKFTKMRPEQLPTVLERLEVQNLDMLGWDQDLLRGINEFIGIQKHLPITDAALDAYLDAGFQFLETGENEKAISCFEKAITSAPNSRLPYLGLFGAVLDEQKEKVYYEKLQSFAENSEIEAEKEYLLKIKNTILQFLFKFIKYQDAARCKICIDSCLKNDIDLNTEKNGYTPLCYAIETGNTDIVKALIASEKVEVGKRCSGDTMCPVQMACMQRSEELLQVLLDAGASPNISYNNPGSQTKSTIKDCIPLVTCIQYGFHEGVELLLKHGASANAKYSQNQLTVLSFALSKSKIKICDLLINRGAKIDEPSAGIPSFVYAVYADDKYMISYIRKKGADFDTEFWYDGKMVDIVYYALVEDCWKAIPEIINNDGEKVFNKNLKAAKKRWILKKLPGWIFTAVSLATIFIILIFVLNFLTNLAANGFFSENQNEGASFAFGMWIGISIIAFVIWFYIWRFFRNPDAGEEERNLYEVLKQYDIKKD